MNYLAHAFLSNGDPSFLTGNMIADHIKGHKALEALPEPIQKGILLHRAIDAFADAHPAVQRAKIWFRADYRLYAGAIIDSLMDHYLANDPRHFPSEQALMDFTQEAYAQLRENAEYFPPAFASYFPHMQEHNWLFNYRSTAGMRRSLNGLHRKAAYMPPPDAAFRIFMEEYHQLAQVYYELMDDLVKYVKTRISP